MTTPTDLDPAPPSAPPNNTLAVVSGAVGLTVGLYFGRYTGLYLLIPILLAIGLGWPFAKLARGNRKPLAIAFGLHAGQAAFVLWYIVFVNSDSKAAFFIDLIVLGVSTLWILVAPSLLPLLILAAFQIAMLIVNSVQRSYYDAHENVSWPATALSVQIIVRLIALVVLAFAVRNFQKLVTADRLTHPMASA